MKFCKNCYVFLLLTMLIITSAAAPDVKPTYVIVGCRIFPVSSSPIENGVIIIRDGLIEAVGTEGKVFIPEDAEIIEANGLHAYPGLIDAHTTHLLEKSNQPRQRSMDMSSFQPSREKPSWQCDDFLAAKSLKLKKSIIKGFHMAGVTTVLVAPEEGIFAGKSVILNLRGEKIKPMIVNTLFSFHLNFITAQEPYPSSLMGTVALIRQLFWDAKHYSLYQTAYGKSPKGIKRPEHDAFLKNIVPYVVHKGRMTFNCMNLEDIKRALRFINEFKLNGALSGANEAWRASDLIKKSGAPLLVSLDFKPPDISMYINQGKNLKEKAEEEIYPANAASLYKHGIKFALTSYGLSRPFDIVKNMRKAIEKGLPVQAALEAMTIHPARFLEIDQSLGTLEPGKIANIILTSGEIFAEKTAVKKVFVDGTPFEVEPPPNKAKSSTQDADKKWKTEINDPRVAVSEPGKDQDLLIKNGTILTVTQGSIPKGDILIIGGLIKQIGTDIDSPKGVKVIDASGKYLMPGIIDAHSHIGINSGNEIYVPLAHDIKVRDALNAEDTSILTALSGGVTMMHTMYGADNPIGGENIVLKTKWGRSSEEMIVHEAYRTMKFAMGENPKQANRLAIPRYPQTRMGVNALIRREFFKAKNYMEQWERYRKALEDKKSTTNLFPPRKDLKMEALVDMLEGKVLARCHAYKADETLEFIKLSKEFGFKIACFEHVSEAFKITKELTEENISLAMFSDIWAYKVEASEGIAYNAANCTKKGILVSVVADDRERIQRLFNDAAKTMKYGGLTEEEALKLITINPAIQLGVEKIVGSLEPGKHGDIAIFNAHPLSAYARCEMTIIEGEVYFDRNRSLKDKRE